MISRLEGGADGVSYSSLHTDVLHQGTTVYVSLLAQCMNIEHDGIL